MGGISLLIAEDEAMTAIFMRTMLSRSGLNVLKCVPSGEEAVDCVLNLSPDVVIMDIRLAGDMNGIEAVKNIRDKSQPGPVFIFTTGYSDGELMEQAMELEPLAFLVKPVNMTELISHIKGLFPDR